MESFKEQVTKAAARISVQIVVPYSDDAELRKQLGLQTTDEFQIADMVGLTLTPNGKSPLGFRERYELAQTIGLFTPRWDVPEIEVSIGNFGSDTFNENQVEIRKFPKTMLFETVVSLYDYCAIIASKLPPDELIFPLKLQYAVTYWKDKKSTNDNQGVIAHSIKLSPEQIALLKTADLPSGPRRQMDLGNPERFTGLGTYELLWQDVSIDFENKQTKEEK